MRQGLVDLVVVGADRIAANGDFANKIGTYSVAVLAKAHGIPFYVAAPVSTIDLATPDGAAHPHRGAPGAGGDARRADAADARRREDPQPGVRRDAARVPVRRSSPSAARAGRRSRSRCAAVVTGLTSGRAELRPCASSASRRRATRRPRPSSRRSTTPPGRGSSARASSRRRSRSTASGAASCRSWRRASTSATSAASSSARSADAADRGGRPRRDRRHAGPGPGRLAARRRVVRQVARRGLAPAARARAPPGRPHRVALPPARPAAAAGDGARRVGRPHQPL